MIPSPSHRREWLKRLSVRLLDETRPPRSWLWPTNTPLHGSKEVLQRQYEQCGKTINRILLATVFLSFYCFLALSVSDQSLMGLEAQIDLPFANFKISYVYFIWIAPLTLLALSLYMHIFVGRFQRLRLSNLDDTTVYVFTLEEPLPRILTRLLYYWLVPLVAWSFTAKGMFRPENRELVVASCLITAVYVLLQIKRCSTENRLLKVLPLGMLLLYLLVTGSNALDKHGSFTRAVSMHGASLKGLDLRGFHMGSWYLEDADLSKTNLKNAFLEFAWLKRAKLLDANLDLVWMPNANLSEADLTGARLSRAFLFQTNFDNASLNSANLANANLYQASLVFADLREANLAWADLRLANLRQAKLTNAILDYSLMTGANLNGAVLTGTSLRRVILWKASLLNVQGITQNQIESACTYENTILPQGISFPKLQPSSCPARIIEDSDSLPPDGERHPRESG